MPYRRLNIPLTSQAPTNPDRPLPAQTLAADTFARADTAKGTLGVTETGARPWQVTGGWRILSERANLIDFTDSFALVDVATPDHNARVTFIRATNGRGALIFRYVDPLNYMLYGKPNTPASTLQLVQVIDGVKTLLVDTGATANATTYGVGAIAHGNTCELLAPTSAVDGVQYPIPDALARGTKVGFWGINATIEADNFAVTDK